MAPKLSLLEAYQKAINNPLRRYQRQVDQLRNAMRGLIPLEESTESQRYENVPNPNNQGPLEGRYGSLGASGTRDRMPGTSPDAKRTRSKKSTGKGYIPTPLDPQYGNRKGYI